MITTHSDTRTRSESVTSTPAPLFARSAGPVAIAAGTLLVVGQLIWWPFDQTKNLATSQNDVFNVGSLVYLSGFCVLMFALIGVHGHQSMKAGRLGTFGVSAAVLGTMLLGGDLWFETFAVPWLAESTGGADALLSSPSALMAVGALSSYLLFAVGWLSFGIASLRARVFPTWISLLLAVGGIAGYQALLAPWGIPLGVGVAALGVWLVLGRSATAS